MFISYICLYFYCA